MDFVNGSVVAATNVVNPPNDLSGDFTIEWWQYETDTNSATSLFQIPNLTIGSSTGILGVFFQSQSPSQLLFFVVDPVSSYKGQPAVAYYTAIPSIRNTWNNFAIVRSGSSGSSPTLTIYQNGNYITGDLVNSSVSPYTVDFSGASSLTIGGGVPSYAFTGQIYGFAWTRGTAKYTSPYTVSTSVPTIPSFPGTTGLVIHTGVTNTLSGVVVTQTNIGSSSNTPGGMMCFGKGVMILYEKDGEDRSIPVEELRVGMRVQTYLHGKKAIARIRNKAYHPTEDRVNRIYRLSTEDYPGLSHDLLLTGGHSVLCDFSQIKEEAMLHIASSLNGMVYCTDDKLRLMTCFIDRARPVTYTGDIYHFALEHPDPTRNYGVYVNGMLVECASLTDLE